MERARQPLIVGVVFALVFGIAAGVLVGRTVMAPGFELPPRWYDAQDYENLALHLAEGRGFGLGWNEPAWVAPYRDEHIASGYKWIDYHDGWRPRDGGFARTTARPPALPTLIALTYRIGGREFGTIRILSALFLALAIATASGLATYLSGVGAGITTALVASVAPHYAGFARLSMTEPMSAALVMVALACCCAFIGTNRLRWIAMAGVTLGLAVLTRSAIVLSLPLVAAALYGLARWWPGRPKRHRPATALFVFLTCALLLPAPWWARNVATLEAPMPLGAQGGIGLLGAYSDEAYTRTLDLLPWTHPNHFGLFSPLTSSPAYQALPATLQERELSRFGQASALDWIRENPRKLPILALRRLQTHWVVREPADIGIRLLALFGFLSLVRRRETWVAAAFVAANSLAIMATFAVAQGRFLASIEGILFLFAGVGLWQLVRLLAGLWKPRAPTEALHSP